MSARLRRSVTHVVALLAGTALFTACPDDDTSSGTCPAGTVLINGDCVASGDTVGGDTSGDTVGGDTVADTGGDSVGTDTTDTGGGGVTLPFAIDDYYAASGYFPAGEATNIATAACPSRAGDEVGLCHGFTWTPGAGDFAGVWWQYPEGNWGDDPGLAVPAGAKAITFWAWGASGGETVKFVSGYASDGFERDTGEITLTTTPTEYTLVLDGATYTDIAGGFGWVATGAAGGAAVTLYVDDIEMTDAGAAAGCTDPLANNYDDTAEVDDGSCTYDAVALPFAIDAWYAPSGYFPAAEGDNIDGTLVCPERAGDELGDCHGFSWTPGSEAFAGVWWQFPDGNWGDGGVDGLAVDAGATAITFWAWGQNGGEVVKFLSGYPTDGYERDSGEITLTTTPTEYRIDLTGVSYTDIAGGFGWVTANGAVTFYVDDIEMTDEVAVGAGCTDSDATNYDAAATSDDGSCTYDVTFRVDVTGQTATTVYLNGEFNDRCGSCAPMTETATAGVWELTVPLAADTWEYKFTIDGTNWEQVPAACGLQTGDFVNRAVTVVDAPIVLPTAPFGACAPETGVALPFALDDYYGPSGFFPEGEANNVDATVACPMRAGDQAGLCHGFTWTPGSGGFAGVWWQNPDGNWGDGPGLLIAEGATKVTFWAWGATGGEVVKFLAGYPSDGFERDSGEITLTTTPTEYSVNLIGADYTDVAGGFGWVTAAGGVTFYVDDITWTNDTGGEVLGCTDPNANNYDDTATVDDSSCEYDRASLPFVVDDHYVPSGFMGDGESGGIVQDATPCPERAGDARGDCHSAVYTPGGAGWGGVFWQFPEDNWGDLPGLPIDPGATKITLWAWGAVGGEKVRFIAGYASDGFERTTSVITLSTTPTAYVVDLAGTTYDDVAGGFGWVAEAPASGTVAFYIDDIAWTADPAGVGCTDADAANYDAAATSDDGSCRYDVTFSVDVSAQGLGDADVVYVSGDFQSELDQAFSDWCGGCTPLVKGADGVWSGTFAVPPGTYAYKFQVNEWASDEAVPTECGVTDGGFTNRGLVVVDAPVVLPTPAWGGCAVAPPAGDILLLTFDDATSTDGWQKVANADSAEGTLAWVDGGGNPGGALEVGGVNTGTDGKAYIFQYLASGLDYGGATSVTVSFDVKVATPLVGAALHLQTEI
ncbi:MAG: hypothetical protein KC635_05545, partial [Myxococcales bacterium]|nr:hypothetical protein [Myxococcales bacterium]